MFSHHARGHLLYLMNIVACSIFTMMVATSIIMSTVRRSYATDVFVRASTTSAVMRTSVWNTLTCSCFFPEPFTPLHYQSRRDLVRSSAYAWPLPLSEGCYGQLRRSSMLNGVPIFRRGGKKMTTSSPMKGKVSTNRSVGTALVITTPQPVCPSSTGNSAVRLLFHPLGYRLGRRRRSMSFMLADGAAVNKWQHGFKWRPVDRRSTVNVATTRTPRIVASR
ncbi:hypothetical protein M513_13466 [Trichuris suis]|uniref:Uncharacterized protein n=1 Tax=Trichuris suis TaxID=68888 RepID=A0A085LL07_9BILA|nr:hypothetical protein M513_13466 [Trichuris suis]